MKNKVAALAAALSVLGGAVTAAPAMADGDGSISAEGVTITAVYKYQVQENGYGVDKEIVIGSATNDGSGWSEIVADFTTNESNTNGRIEIYCETPNVDFWVDDVAVLDEEGKDRPDTPLVDNSTYYLENGTMGGPDGNGKPWWWGPTSTWINGGNVVNAKVKYDDTEWHGEPSSMYVYDREEGKTGAMIYTGNIATKSTYSFTAWVKAYLPEDTPDDPTEDNYEYAMNETFEDAEIPQSIHQPYDNGKAEVTNGALKVTNRIGNWIGAGCNVTLDAGYHYTLEFDVQDSSDQKFSYDAGAGARVNSVQQTDGTDGWEHCTAEIDVYDNEAVTYTTTIWIQSNAADDYTIDNIKIYRDADAKKTVGPKVKFETVGNITAETKTGTGTYENDKATGFVATITNTGEEEGTFNTVNWTVQSGGDTGKTGDKTITTVTVPKDGTAQIALIVTGLDDAGATATVTVK